MAGNRISDSISGLFPLKLNSDTAFEQGLGLAVQLHFTSTTWFD
jgi:hypothetical protein